MLEVQRRVPAAALPAAAHLAAALLAAALPAAALGLRGGGRVHGWPPRAVVCHHTTLVWYPNAICMQMSDMFT